MGLGKVVDLRGLEPLNLLYAIQALYQLSYRPINILGISSNSCNIFAEKQSILKTPLYSFFMDSLPIVLGSILAL